MSSDTNFELVFAGPPTTMAELSLPAAGLPEGRFRVDAALHKAAVALWHNLLPFCTVAGIAVLPSLMWSDDSIVAPQQLVWAAATMAVMAFASHTPPELLWPAAGVVLSAVLGALSQAISSRERSRICVAGRGA